MRLLGLLATLLVVAAACSDGDETVTSGSTAAAPSCEEITTFAEALLDTNIAYDYQPSTSPADLAATVDVVFAGRLTGEIVVRDVDGEDGRAASFVGYGVEVTEVPGTPSIPLTPGSDVDVFVEFGDPADQGTDRYRDAAAAARGTLVAVFATETEIPGLVAAIEGFMTACDDGGLLGRTGSTGGWAAVGSVAEVIDSVDAGSTAGPDPSDPVSATAVWRLDDGAEPTAASTSFTALVSRLGCSGGRTGEVLEPDIDITEGSVTVTFWAAPLPAGNYNCPGNDEVPVDIELGEPLGERTLVDGACLDGEAVTTSFCSEGATRWPPT